MRVENVRNHKVLFLVLFAALAAPSGDTVSAGSAAKAEMASLAVGAEGANEVAKSEAAMSLAPQAGTVSRRLSNLAKLGELNPAQDEPAQSIPPDQTPAIIVGKSVSNDESPALRDMKIQPVTPKEEGDEMEANENPKLPHRHVDQPDPVIQRTFREPNAPVLNMPSPLLTFDGIVFPGVACNCAPPDTNGEVGLTQYVQMVNEGFQIFDKTTGASVLGPAGITTLWAGFGGVCENNGSGDPVVLYDQLADRWVITQFAGVAVPTDECIAVSKTGDATGAYYRYDFNLGTNFFDYPHLGVWPDGYYMAMNVFNTAGSAFLGPQAFVFDRAKMLAGLPATFQTPGITGGATEDSFLPADLDGYSLPPANAPNSFVETPFTGTYRTFHFHVDWAVPANSTFTLFASPVSAAFSELCGATRACVPQLGSADNLDGIGDRLMYRLAYRNIGGVESLVGNHTVLAGGVAAPRWFELRGVTAGPVTVFQESTYQPDTTWRWMGSAAMDNQGNLALGYSASSAAINPDIRYAGRLASDPVNTLAQGEATLHAGTGSQIGTGNRWGDYSDLTVDPSDDCTFWYTQEYYSTTATFAWRTRIGNFKFPTCTQSPRGTISGTITSCQTGLPIPNAQVTIDGGYGRGTDAAGMYSAILAPGTYNGSVTGAGYDTASQTGMVVNNGGNVTFNACLNGNLKQPVADTSSILADACAPSNGVIDPNEAVTISLGIKNTGTLSTVNLVGTLQATGGVTSPGAPQNYGVVVAGGATVFRPFTFTAANLSCGSPIMITLQLQDGATNLGTATYNNSTGVLVTNNYSSGNVAVPVPDNLPAGVDIPITVTDVMTLSDVNVSIRVNHTFDGDLNISLIHPDNTSVPLSLRRGSGGDNFGTGANDCSGVGTVFDDQALTLISAGAAPFSGSFKPETLLSALNGKPSNGTWKLHVADAVATDTGTVGCFKLELNRRSVCCGSLINAAPPPVLVSESMTPPNNAPDPNEAVTVNLPLVNVGGTPTTNLVATLQASGGITAPSGPQSYGALSDGGSPVSRPFSFRVGATCGSTITLTLALQDGATNLGTVTYTMQVGTTVAGAPQTFSNATTIIINDLSTATPYPSNIAVSGVVGTVGKVTVTLNQLNHTFPNDVDVLLVGPTGNKFILMSDVIGGTDWVNTNYTFDDAGAAFIPISAAPVAGTFKPTNYTICQDPFTATAPAGPYLSPGGITGQTQCGTNTLTTAFAGTNPNGTWSLYVVDDVGTDTGQITGGWSLTITPNSPVCSSSSCGNGVVDAGEACDSYGLVGSCCTASCGVAASGTVCRPSTAACDAQEACPGGSDACPADVNACIPTAPTVTSPTSSSITGTTATLGGNVTLDGGSAITDRGVVYAQTAANNDPQIGGTSVTKVTVVGTTGLFSTGVTGLAPTTGHSFKAFATNVIGTSYTSVATFATTCPVITLGSLPDGNLTVPYTGSATASGGTGPYTYAVTSGTLPGGLSLTASGAGAGDLSGTPTSTGTFPFDITATDTSGTGTCTGVQSYSVVIGPEPGQDFFTLAPCRVLDTRNAAGPLGGPALVALADRSFVMTGACGIPANAKGISLNIAVTQPTIAGNIRLHPGGTSVPLVSSINYKAGQTRSNNAVVPLSALGELAAYLDQVSGTAHLIIDVNGYFK